MTINDEDVKTYSDCLKAYEDMQNVKTLVRGFIIFGSILVAIMFVALYIVYCYKKKRCCGKRDDEVLSNIAVRAHLLQQNNQRGTDNIYIL